MLLPDYDTGLRSASLIPNAKWRKRGLVAVFFGGSAVWTAWAGPRPFAPTGGPKPVGSKFGKATGFGTTYGTGTTDRLDGGVLPRPASGWRSIVSHYYANGTGGGGVARIFQDASGTGLQAGEEIQIFSGQYILYGLYASTTYGAWFTTAGLATGRWQSFGVTHDQRTVNQTPSLWMDGASTAAQLSQSASGSYQTTPCNMVWGNRASDGARGWDGILGPTFIFDNADGLTADEHATLHKDPLQVFTPDEIEIWVPFGAAGGTTVAPGSGHLTISGKQPTVSQTDHHTVSPGAGHIAASGKQPSVAQTDHHTLSPGAGHLTLSGKQPSVAQTAGTTVSPGAGHLSASGKQPIVAQTDHHTLSPGVGHLALSGKQPTVTRTNNQTVSSGVGHLTASGKQPSITQSGSIVISPATWHLIFTGHQPTVSQTSATPKPWDDPDEFYDAGPYGFATSVLLAQTTFAGILDTADANAWEHAAITTHKLRLRSEQPLADGDLLTIEDATYRVVGTPQRLNRAEKLAHLVRQS